MSNSKLVRRNTQKHPKIDHDNIISTLQQQLSLEIRSWRSTCRPGPGPGLRPTDIKLANLRTPRNVVSHATTTTTTTTTAATDSNTTTTTTIITLRSRLDPDTQLLSPPRVLRTINSPTNPGKTPTRTPPNTPAASPSTTTAATLTHHYGSMVTAPAVATSSIHSPRRNGIHFPSSPIPEFLANTRFQAHSQVKLRPSVVEEIADILRAEGIATRDFAVENAAAPNTNTAAAAAATAAATAMTNQGVKRWRIPRRKPLPADSPVLLLKRA